MSTDKLIQALGNRLNRRNFLVRTGVGTVGALAAAMGVSREARAGGLYPDACCNLCNPGTIGGCTGCKCQWCWECSNGPTNYYCCECFGPDGDCGDDCYDVGCSYVQCLSGCPQVPAT